MQLTPGQLRDVVGISQETLRHWRATLEPLKSTRGHGPSFKPAQVLGAAVIKAIVEECGVSVRSLKSAAPVLFDVCAHPNWEVLSRGRIALQLSSGSAEFLDEGQLPPSAPTLILIAMAPIVRRLRQALFDVPSEEQAKLHLSPMNVGKNSAVMPSARGS
jgi:hypothetical protein